MSTFPKRSGPLRWSPGQSQRASGRSDRPAAADALRRMSGGAAQMRFVLESGAAARRRPRPRLSPMRRVACSRSW
jgi:hypothetical protein